MARSHVVAWNCNENRNVMVRAHENPILDTMKYQVEFAGGEVKELIANVIIESTYTLCSADRNEFLLLGLIIDFHNDDKSVSITDEQTST